MTGIQRREEIIKTMRESGNPVSGALLARKYEVSRQVIVQDIALLRAMDYDILSTARGYQLAEEREGTGRKHVSGNLYRVFHVSHTDDQMEDELNLIVDNEGKVLDVFVEHSVYGAIRGDLKVSFRRHVQDFLEDIQRGKSSPLKNLTSGVHYHTVEGTVRRRWILLKMNLRRGATCYSG